MGFVTKGFLFQLFDDLIRWQATHSRTQWNYFLQIGYNILHFPWCTNGNALKFVTHFKDFLCCILGFISATLFPCHTFPVRSVSRNNWIFPCQREYISHWGGVKKGGQGSFFVFSCHSQVLFVKCSRKFIALQPPKTCNNRHPSTHFQAGESRQTWDQRLWIVRGSQNRAWGQTA